MPRASRQAREAMALPEPGPSYGASGPGAGGRYPISLYSSHRPRLRGRSGTAASTVSTLLVVALLGLLISSPAASSFRNGFLNVHQMWVAFVGDPAKGILSVGKGFLLNLWLSVVCEAIVLVLALGVASLRLTRGPVLLPFRALAIAYTDFARGVPVILVMLWVGFGVPSLNLDKVSSQSPVVYAGFVLVFSYTAYVAEVYRAGLMSVPRAQVQAARSLGLSSRTTLWPGGAPPGRAQRPAGAAERLRFAAEGHRHRLDARGRRGGPCRPDRRGRRVQLLRLYDRVPAVPRRHRAAHPLHGPRHGTGQVSPARRHNGVSTREQGAGTRRRGAPGGRRPPVLRAVGVHKSFGALEVLRGVDLTITAHEVVCVIGSSGSGKSTLLRCCNLLERVDSGTIELFGHDLGDERIDEDLVRRHTGMVFQSFNLFPHLSVLDNVTLAPRRVLRLDRAPGRATRPGAAQPDRPGGQGVRVPRAFVRRPAAARRDRPVARDEPPATAPRRGHVRARPGARRGGARPRPRTRAPGHDNADRNARDGLRP